MLNAAILSLVVASCLLPFVHIASLSLSDSIALKGNPIILLPARFTLASYNFVLAKREYFDAMWMSLKRILLGSGINMFMVVITAYPMSKAKASFHARNGYMWFLS